MESPNPTFYTRIFLYITILSLLEMTRGLLIFRDPNNAESAVIFTVLYADT